MGGLRGAARGGGMRRPLRLRLVLRDLSTAAAFASMAISSQVPVWALVLFALALIVALTGRRPLARAPRLTALLLLPVAGALYLLVASGRMDLVVAACSFAGIVAAQRLLSESSAATDGQVLLVGLLMIAGGAALSGELVFAMCLLAFAVLASLSLGLAVVEAAVPPGEPVPVRAVMRPLARGTLLAVVGAVLFFVFIPRLNWNMGVRRATPGLGTATSGFSDTVRLGGSGTLKSNPRVVLRARLTPDPVSTEHLSAYWVGRTYDTFDGQEWSTIGAANRRHRTRVTLRPGADKQVYQRIELLPAYGSRTLIALETPAKLGNALTHTPTGDRRTRLQELGGDELRFVDDGLGYSYEVYSLPPGTDTDPGRMNETEMAQLLALPENLDPRVEQLARRVVGDEQDPLAAAQKLSAWLQREYQYTLELSGDLADPLEDFLFVRKAGHCEHFATALTLLLRTLGFEARLATGFFGGERVGDEYIVRAGDAHAWTHVLVPGRGFVTVDATPPAFRANQSLQILESLVSFYEAIEGIWRTSVVDYSFRDQIDFMRGLSRPPRDPSSPERPSGPPARAWWTAGLVALGVYGLVRYLSRRPRRPSMGEATRLVDAVERQLTRAGLPPRDGETLEDVSARFTRDAHPLGPTLAPLTRRYLEARFGQRPLESGERARMLEDLRRALDTWRQGSRSNAP
ncbi:transglutaminase [Cystobacter ferrugineus]|uniref:Transglutaminase n=2 Tax=Cystobacter ferrugineus TaxID=83449 RepID=A0A1L9B9A7_9BACT|nr:transglutaminase [Cystobacter ferrugineus]